MKNVIGLLVCMALCIGCADKPPSVQVSNQRATKANVQIKQANGNTINHNDVVSGVVSTLQDIAEGEVIVTAVIQSEAVSPTITFNATMDNNYTIVILAGNPPALRIDSQGK